MECILVYDRVFLSGYVDDLTFLWMEFIFMKDICQSDSHFC